MEQFLDIIKFRVKLRLNSMLLSSSIVLELLFLFYILQGFSSQFVCATIVTFWFDRQRLQHDSIDVNVSSLSIWSHTCFLGNPYRRSPGTTSLSMNLSPQKTRSRPTYNIIHLHSFLHLIDWLTRILAIKETTKELISLVPRKMKPTWTTTPFLFFLLLIGIRMF